MNLSRPFPFITLVLAGGLLASAPAAPAAEATNAPAQGELAKGQMPYFDAVNDPLEGFNRGSWAVNEWIFRRLIYPVSKGYNKLTPKPIREGIGKAGHNLTYPVRLVNSTLQGKWKGAWEETKRFGVNSTVGVGGLFDPATKWKIGRSDEDFGQTMGHWGVGPGFYLMIPIAGPSNGRDAVGKIVDLPLDLCFWIRHAYNDPLWAKAIRPGITFNDLSDAAPMLKDTMDSLVDPYQALRTLYSLNRDRLILDYLPSVGGDFNPDPTVGAVLFKPLTPEFGAKAETRKVLVPQTGKKIAYTCWMQKRPAPLVFYIPGLGSYRLDRSTLAYADLMYRHASSVVTISNPFQKEFMEQGSTMPMPGYGPADCDDVVNLIKLVLADLRKEYGDVITETSLTGVSHGGYFTLMIAAREAEGKLDGLTFDRYVAVNPPVSLARALHSLDELFKAPLNWPETEREQRMKEAIYKALYFAQSDLDLSGNIPLTLEESQFLIGLVFRYTLMTTIASTQRRHDQGVLDLPPGKFVRQKSYREIREISYGEYLDRFMIPYLIKSGRGTDAESLMAATDLMRHEAAFRGNPKVRVQICEDDFLLNPTEIAWLRATLGNQLKVYERGGHLGNLHVPSVQAALVRQFPHTAY